MRKIEKRGVFCLILAALLGIGLAFFCFRFVADGGDWASYPYNRHLYTNEGVLKGGTVLDRDAFRQLRGGSHKYVLVKDNQVL